MATRDSQRQKVYNFETDFEEEFPSREYTTREAQKLVNQIVNRPVWRSMRQSLFTVTVWRNDRFKRTIGQSSHFGRVMSLSPEGHRKIVIVHELAHSMTTHIFLQKVAWHGPEYMWVYRLLAEENLTKAQFLRWEKLALKHGVRWDRKSVESRVA